MRKVYYIAKDVGSNNPNDLNIGVRVFLEKYNPFIKYTDENIEGPFENIKELKNNSSIFKSLVKSNPQRAEIIFKDKYIIKVEDYITSSEDSTYSKDFMNLFRHTIQGEIKSKRIYGIHLFDSQKMKIKNILGKEDKNLIWKAVVEVLDANTNEWIEKESTFFPRIWSLNRLFHECYYAVENRKKIGEFRYISLTLSGVPVDIIIKNQELKSIYPIYME